MAKAGHPTDYKEEYNELAYKLTLLGHTDKELASFFCVTETTINNWKNSHPLFFESLRKGKNESDYEVVKALRKRAMGYQYDEKTTVTNGDGDTQSIKTVNKDIAPDTGAAFIWLKNRQPDEWRDRQEITHNIVDANKSQEIEKYVNDKLNAKK